MHSALLDRGPEARRYVAGLKARRYVADRKVRR
jgi:hypothetical protein